MAKKPDPSTFRYDDEGYRLDSLNRRLPTPGKPKQRDMRKVARCSVDGCDRAHKARGLCELHRQQQVAGKELTLPKKYTGPYQAPGKNTVTLGISMDPAIAREVDDFAGTGYGKRAAFIRKAIMNEIHGRDADHWREQARRERSARLVAEDKLRRAREALG